MANNFFRPDSFVKNTELISNRFLDYNQLPAIEKSAEDDKYVIDYVYEGRPDLLAYALYENPRLWWVFALRNPDLLEDPIRDFKQGLEIYLPNAVAIDTILRTRGTGEGR